MEKEPEETGKTESTGERGEATDRHLRRRGRTGRESWGRGAGKTSQDCRFLPWRLHANQHMTFKQY